VVSVTDPYSRNFVFHVTPHLYSRVLFLLDSEGTGSGASRLWMFVLVCYVMVEALRQISRPVSHTVCSKQATEKLSAL
jgi:hypothetical protein